MGKKKHDPVTGRMTTGHEWNGIEELDTPVPRFVFFFLIVTTLFGIGYWILMPAWPIGSTYTKGLLGYDHREVVVRQVVKAADARSVWTDKIEQLDYAQIKQDPELMRHVMASGRTRFIDNCAACHGTSATGGPGFPDLTSNAFLWGGDVETLAETIRVGINSTHDETRSSEMLAFGRDGMLDHEQIRNVATYVRSLSQSDQDTPFDAERVSSGETIFAENCAACHGDDASGNQDMGAPNLADAHWIYGGDAQSVFTSIYEGRKGHMPHWDGKLSELDLKILALYVDALGKDKP